MLKKMICCLIVTAFVLLPSTAFSKDLLYGKWWQMKEVVNRLNLGDEEIEKLNDAYYHFQRTLIDLKAVAEKGELDLENQLGKRNMAEKAVLDVFNKLEAARSNLSLERFKFLLQARKIIGFDRFTLLKSMYEKLRKQKLNAAQGKRAPKKKPDQKPDQKPTNEGTDTPG